MIINPVLVGIISTLFVEMSIVIIGTYIIDKRKGKHGTKDKTL